MTGVLAIRCNVQASYEARQRSLVGFGLFREPMEQLMGGAWRLHTSSAIELDFPNRSGAAKTKSAPVQHRHSSYCTRRAADSGVLGRRRASFSRHPGRLAVLGRVRGQQLSFAAYR
jgi:hypothetical protein